MDTFQSSVSKLLNGTACTVVSSYLGIRALIYKDNVILTQQANRFNMMTYSEPPAPQWPGKAWSPERCGPPRRCRRLRHPSCPPSDVQNFWPRTTCQSRWPPSDLPQKSHRKPQTNVMLRHALFTTELTVRWFHSLLANYNRYWTIHNPDLEKGNVYPILRKSPNVNPQYTSKHFVMLWNLLETLCRACEVFLWESV